MNRATAGIVVTLAVILIAFFWIDRSLEKLELGEVRNEASGLAAEGKRLLAAGHGEEAIPRFQRAHFLVRANHGYAFGYAEALLAAGDLTRAESVLREELDQNSNEAQANLLMARVMRARGNVAQADSFYHRAIYGSWSKDATENRQKVRLELAGWLAERGAKDELLAELLPVQAAARDDATLGRQVAGLMLTAGSPARAADQYRALIQRDKTDAAAYRGLGEAELKLGNYAGAQRAFLNAVRQDGTNIESAKRLQMLSAVVSLDPMPRWLPVKEKYERSKKLLAGVKEELAACGIAPLPQDAKPAPNPAPETISNESAESSLTSAEQLWRQRPSTCPAQPDDPIKFIMDKLTADSSAARAL